MFQKSMLTDKKEKALACKIEINLDGYGMDHFDINAIDIATFQRKRADTVLINDGVLVISWCLREVTPTEVYSMSLKAFNNKPLIKRVMQTIEEWAKVQTEASYEDYLTVYTFKYAWLLLLNVNTYTDMYPCEVGASSVHMQATSIREAATFRDEKLWLRVAGKFCGFNPFGAFPSTIVWAYLHYSEYINHGNIAAYLGKIITPIAGGLGSVWSNETIKELDRAAKLVEAKNITELNEKIVILM